MSQLGHYRPALDSANSQLYREVCVNNVQLVAHYALYEYVNRLGELEAADPKACAALTDEEREAYFPQAAGELRGLAEWWPHNPYTGAALKVFTPADGAIDEVFSRGTADDPLAYNNLGEVYWQPLEDGGVRVSVYLDEWPRVAAQAYKYSVAHDTAWEEKEMNSGVVFSLVSSPQVAADAHLRYRVPVHENEEYLERATGAEM